MRGGYIHNQVLLPAVVASLRALGASVSLEYPVRAGTRNGAVDAMAELGGRRLVVELTNSSRRVGWEIEKAWALRAHDLILMTPNGRVRDACLREITRKLAAESFPGLAIYVLTLATIHQWVANYFRLISSPIEASASKTIPGDTLTSSPPGTTHYENTPS